MIGLMIRIMILVGLVKLLVVTEKPFLCAGIYAAVGLFFRFLLGVPFPGILIATAISLALASLYFWLLARFVGSGWFWLIMMVGFAIGIV